jgi:hypothetical protein
VPFLFSPRDKCSLVSQLLNICGCTVPLRTFSSPHACALRASLAVSRLTWVLDNVVIDSRCTYRTVSLCCCQHSC